MPSSLTVLETQSTVPVYIGASPGLGRGIVWSRTWRRKNLVRTAAKLLTIEIFINKKNWHWISDFQVSSSRVIRFQCSHCLNIVVVDRGLDKINWRIAARLIRDFLEPEVSDIFRGMLTSSLISVPICQNTFSPHLVKNKLRVFSESLEPSPI